MDIQTRKLNIIEELLRVRSEKLIEKLERTLREEKVDNYETNLKPMSLEEFHETVNKSLNDARQGRVVGTKELKDISKQWK